MPCTADIHPAATPGGHGRYLLPDPSDHMVVLAAHFITDREVGGFGALGQLADIARVLERSDMERVGARSTEWGLRAYQDEPNATKWGGQDVFDIHTTYEGTALDGTKYTDW